MGTEAMLLFGASTIVVFYGVVLVEGARRPGYDPMYHTGSHRCVAIRPVHGPSRHRRG